MIEKDIDVTMTSDKGCTVNIKGKLKVEWTREKGWHFAGFAGTVSVSGGAGCANGSMTFTSPTTKRKGSSGRALHATFDKEDVLRVSKITWQGDSTVSAILNEGKINRALANVIRSVPFANIKTAA